MNQKVDSLTRAAIIRDYQNGVKPKELASKYRISRATIGRVLRPAKDVESAIDLAVENPEEVKAIVIDGLAGGDVSNAMNLKEKLEVAIDHMFSQATVAPVNSAEGAAKAGVALAQFYRQAFPMTMKELAAFVMTHPNFNASDFAQALRELYGKI